MSIPYRPEDTYVVVAFATGEPVSVVVTLFPDEQARFAVSTSGDWPVLTMKHGPTAVRIQPDVAEQITDTDVSVARQLTEAAGAYQAEVERRYVEQMWGGA